MNPLKKYHILSLIVLIIVAACNNNQSTSKTAESSTWPEPYKIQFMKYCNLHLKEQNSSKAEETCDCILKNVIEKYPVYEHADTLEQQQWENLVVSSNCVEKELLQENTSWGKAEETEFTKQCIAAALKKGDKEEDSKRFCKCALDKVKIILPNPDLTTGLTEEEYNKVITECESGK